MSEQSTFDILAFLQRLAATTDEARRALDSLGVSSTPNKQSELLERKRSDSTKGAGIKETKTYKVAVPQGDHDIFFQFVPNVYTWEFDEDDRLIFWDGNREIIGVFEKRLYFVKVDEGDE